MEATALVPGRLIRISAVTELADDVVEGNAPFPTPESKVGVLAFPELVPTELDHPSGASPSAWRHGSPAPAPPRRSPARGISSRSEKGEEIAERIVRFLRESA